MFVGPGDRAGRARPAGQLLAVTSYNPGAVTTTTTTSTTGENVDATNLSITFMVPPSGNVIVSLKAMAVTSSGNTYWWCLRTTGGANVTGSRQVASQATSFTSAISRVLISGLIPGTVTTYRWGHGISANNGSIRYGDDGTSAPGGPAVMEVWISP